MNQLDEPLSLQTRSPQSVECSIPLQATINLIIVLPLGLVFASVLALPANVGPSRKDVDFHVFPESAGLDSLKQRAGNGTLDNEDGDYDIEAQSPETAATDQCTLADLKKIMFDYSMSEFQDARDAKSPSCFDWYSDACTLSPDRPLDFNFIPPCQRHDLGDANFKAKGQWNLANKSRTDWRFREDMLDVCATYKGFKGFAQRGLCTVLANNYALAVLVANPVRDM